MATVGCRVCLVTDVKLFNLNEHDFAKTFEETTGLSVSPSDGLPQHICYLCCAHLRKLAAFKMKCFYTDNVLRSFLNERETINLEKIKVEYNIEPPLVQDIVLIDDIGEHLETEYKISDEEVIDIGEYIIKDIKDNHEEKTCIEIIKEKKAEGIEILQHDIEEIFEVSELHEEDDSIYLDENDYNFNIDECEYAYIIDNTEIIDENVNIEKKEEFTDSDDEILAKKKQRLRLNKCDKDRDVINRFGVKDKDYDSIGKKYNMHVTIYSKEEQLQQLSARKESESYKSARFKCKTCFTGFRNASAFKHHMTNHTPNKGNFCCDICKIYFVTKKRCKDHLEEHRVRYTCRACKKSFQNQYHVEQHQCSLSEMKIMCKICYRPFDRRSSYYNHIRLCHCDRVCNLCGVSFMGERGLEYHLRRSHKEATSTKSMKFICPSCGLRFLDKNMLTQHMENNCSPFICPSTRCGANFPTVKLLAQHIPTHNPMTFSCDRFQKAIVGELNLGMRRQNLNSGQSRKRRRRQQPRNEKVNASKKKEKQFPIIVCDYCGKCFRHRAGLASHITLHTGEKPHECPVCYKTFRLPVSLKAHLMVHNDERPYVCPHCPARFRQSGHRKHHILIHTQEKPHMCDVCGKSFGLLCNLREHVRVLHAGLPPHKRARRGGAKKEPQD